MSEKEFENRQAVLTGSFCSCVVLKVSFVKVDRESEATREKEREIERGGKGRRKDVPAAA